MEKKLDVLDLNGKELGMLLLNDSGIYIESVQNQSYTNIDCLDEAIAKLSDEEANIFKAYIKLIHVFDVLEGIRGTQFAKAQIALNSLNHILFCWKIVEEHKYLCNLQEVSDENITGEDMLIDRLDLLSYSKQGKYHESRIRFLNTQLEHLSESIISLKNYNFLISCLIEIYGIEDLFLEKVTLELLEKQVEAFNFMRDELFTLVNKLGLHDKKMKSSLINSLLPPIDLSYYKPTLTKHEVQEVFKDEYTPNLISFLLKKYIVI